MATSDYATEHLELGHEIPIFASNPRNQLDFVRLIFALKWECTAANLAPV